MRLLHGADNIEMVWLMMVESMWAKYLSKLMTILLIEQKESEKSMLAIYYV